MHDNTHSSSTNEQYVHLHVSNSLVALVRVKSGSAVRFSKFARSQETLTNGRGRREVEVVVSRPQSAPNMAEVADDLERAAENERAPADKREDALKRAGTGKQAHVEGPIPWAEMTNVQRAHHVKTEVLLGIIITFAQVPESVAFAFLAHVRPPIALHAAWVVGLICGVFGGRPGMINGATGAFAAIIATFLPPPSVPGGNGEGIELLFPSVILAGVLMGLVWLLRGARYITLIPESVMVGFCNGLAIVIGNAQLHPFREGHGPDAHWKSGAELGFMLFIMVVAMVTMEYVPKIPCAYARLVPSSLISIGCAIVIEFGLGRPLGFRTDTIGDVAQFTSDSVFPMPFMLDPQYDLSRLWAPDALSTVLQQGVMLCLVGVIESLLTTEVVTELVKTPADSAAVVWSMGLANVVSGTLGGARRGTPARARATRPPARARHAPARAHAPARRARAPPGRHGRQRDDRPLDDQRAERRHRPDRAGHDRAVHHGVHRGRVPAAQPHPGLGARRRDARRRLPHVQVGLARIHALGAATV